MGEAQQPEVIKNPPGAVEQPSATPAGGNTSTENGSPPVQDAGPAPPAYQPPATTRPANFQQSPITQASYENARAQEPPAPKEAQQQQHPQQLVTPLHALTEAPAWIDCPFCQRRTQTRSTRQGDSQQVLASILCCLVCVCLACLPSMAGWCENINIYCSNCGKQVAMIPHDGMIQVTPAPAPTGPGNSNNNNGLTPSRYAS
ncbi:hypothetical protein GGR51DRAFT_28540 [Nemania sp. FL0031]|nr:hypothetical protein GGR51DRAFT_28540 [Nemania sp. FL0031]